MPADLRPAISQALRAFEDHLLADAARRLFAVLGYESDRRLNLGSSAPQAFLDFVRTNLGTAVFNEDKAMFAEWRTADLLFQFTGQELSEQLSLFDENDVNVGLMQSYMFFAIELAGGDYARGKLTNIARQINRVFPMPVMVLIKHLTGGQPAISIAVINRRQNQRDAAKAVLGKVTIIRDIMLRAPHLLVHGLNGSGKSSLYWALYTFLQSAGKSTGEVAKYFDPDSHAARGLQT